MRIMVEEHDQCISSLELASEDLSQQVTDLEETCTTLPKANAKLKDKVTDLEGWSRHQNVQILGVPESIEGGSPSKFFSNLLCKVLKLESYQPLQKSTALTAPWQPSQSLGSAHGWSFFVCIATRPKSSSTERLAGGESLKSEGSPYALWRIIAPKLPASGRITGLNFTSEDSNPLCSTLPGCASLCRAAIENGSAPWMRQTNTSTTFLDNQILLK